ncbi:MAG: autotransporter-associated beta strand repeat-containing protein [Tepidisphaeraceae bacterium]
MSKSPISRIALSLAALAALPVASFAADRPYNTGSNWLSASTWTGGIFAGTYGSGVAAEGTDSDVATFGSASTFIGTGVNFTTVNASAQGYFSSGAFAFTSAFNGSTSTFSIGGIQPTVAGTVNGIWQLNGATVTTSAIGAATPVTLDNAFAVIADGATRNILLTNQSVTSTATDGSASADRIARMTYRLGASPIANTYVTSGRSLRIVSALTESTAGTTVVKSGTGTLEFGSQLNGISNSAVNTFTNLDIKEGLVIMDGGLNSLGAANGTITIRNGSELRFNWNSANIASTKSFVLDGGGVINNNSYVVTIQGAVTGTGGLTKTGAASLILNNTANNFTGGLTIGNGTTASTVTIGTAGALGAGTNTTTINNLSTLAFDAISGATQTVAATRTVNLAGATGNLSVASGETWTINSAITGTGTLVKTGAGSLNISGATSYTGGTTVSTGNLYINTDQTGTATGNATVASGAQLAGSGKIGAASIAVGGVITAGTSSNVVSTLVANGNVTLTDGTTAGTYKHDFASNGDTHESFTVGGTFDITGGTLQFTNLAAAGEASYTLATAGTLTGTFANVTGLVGGYTVGYTANSITLTRGNTSLYFTGAAGADLGTVNNFTTDAAGTNTTSQTPTASADVYFNATANTNPANYATTIAANTFVNSLTFGNDGASDVQINGTNTLTIKAIGINYAAGTGIVVPTGAAKATINTPVVVGGSQSWTNNASNALAVTGTVALGANTLTVAGSGNTDLTGVVSGTGGLTKSGAGTLNLTAANTYTGTTTVAAGTLKANEAASAVLLTGAGGADVQGGKLVLDYTGGTSPVVSVKTILDAGYAGNFATGQIKGTTLAANRTLGYGDSGTAVTIRVTLAGDADLDGDVDFNDFLVLQSKFGQANTRFDEANFNYDGFTDFNDFLALQANFGQSVTGDEVAFTSAQVAAMTAFASVVPEPASLTLIGMGAAGLLGRRRRSN